MSEIPNTIKLPLRLILLGFFAVLVQESAISQISIFGVSADITPLVVMSVGLLCGSLTGAIFGFGTGLLIDLVLVQTLGVTSLLYIAIGYWAGRLHELRDPAHGLVPLAAGRCATAFAGIGMAMIQFLLGVDAPVSLLLLQQIFIIVLVNTLIALPVYALVRRIMRPVLPEDPRRRRRRAYTTGGLSPLQQAPPAAVESPAPDLMAPLPRRQQLRFVKQEERPPMSPQLALRRGDHRDARPGAVRDPVLPPLVPAGAVGQPVLRRPRASTSSATSRSPAPRGEILDCERHDAGLQPARLRGRDLAARPAGPDHRSEPRPPAARRMPRCTCGSRAWSGCRPTRQPCPVDGHGLLRMSEIACDVVQGYVQLPYGEADGGQRHLRPAAPVLPRRAPEPRSRA